MKNILLTGPARGIGLSISKQLLIEGYHLIGIGRSLTPEYQALINASNPGVAEFIKFDLTNLDAIPLLIKNITQKYGSIYGLVNNSGVGNDGILATMHAKDISHVLKVNLEAPITLAKYASRSMLKRRAGRIISISSVIASTGYSGLSVYAASKAGIEGFSRSLSREIGKLGITVNCVAPGFIETSMTTGLQGEKLESIRRRSPLGLATTEDIADAVTYLLSDAANKITGTVITVDGGSTA